MEEKCPCENCICYPICNTSKTIVPLVFKCYLLASYIITKDDAYEVIKFFKPSYYAHDYAATSKATLVRENIQKIVVAADAQRSIYGEMPM